MALIGLLVTLISVSAEKMCDYYGHIHVYSTGTVADNPRGPKLFHKHKSSVHLPISISCKFCPSNHLLSISPLKCMRDLRGLCRKIGQCHHRIIMYTNFVKLPQGFMTNFKITGLPVLEKKIFKGFCYSSYSHGGHLGNVTWTIYTFFRSTFLRMLRMKFGFDWPSGHRGEDL